MSIARGMLKNWNIGFLLPVVGNAVNVAFKFTSESVVGVHTPREYLEGRDLTLLNMMNTITNTLKGFGIPIPELKFGAMAMSGSEFGFVLMRSKGVFGPYEMFTGQDGISSTNHFVSAFGNT